MNSLSVSVVLKCVIEAVLLNPTIEFFNNSIEKYQCLTGLPDSFC